MLNLEDVETGCACGDLDFGREIATLSRKPVRILATLTVYISSPPIFMMMVVFYFSEYAIAFPPRE